MTDHVIAGAVPAFVSQTSLHGENVLGAFLTEAVPPLIRQFMLAGFAPVYVYESGTRDEILAGIYVNEVLAGETSSITLSNHIFDYGLECTGLDTAFDFNCVQGTTVLDSWTETVTVAEGAVVRSHTLPLAAANAITDYTDLRVRGVARA